MVVPGGLPEALAIAGGRKHTLASAIAAASMIRFALRLLLRHLRAGELTLLVVALVLAVAGMSGVAFLGDRIAGALEREANQLLGGDLLLSADHPLGAGFEQEAGRRGLRVARSELFPSMVARGEAMRLAGIKSVGQGYPLRGAPRIASAVGQADGVAVDVPPRGGVWPDERLAAELGLKVGDILTLGEARLRVAAILTFEADRGGNFLSLAPRLVMNSGDLPGTGLVREGSRITYRLHVAGEPGPVAAFATWAKERLGRGEKLEDVAQARPETRANLEKAERFLRLAALLSVVLAAVSVGLAARRFMERNQDGCAVMRCLGAREKQVLGLFMVEFLALGLMAGLAGCALGYGVQAGLVALLTGLLGLPLPAPSWLPLGQGMALSLVLVAGFVLPWLLRLGRVPTLRVLRREWGGSESVGWVAWVTGGVALAALMAWIAADPRLAAILCGGLAAVLVTFGVLASLLFALLARLGRRLDGAGGWRLGLAAISRRRGGLAVQAVALALGLTALLTLLLAREDLMGHWRASLPPDAPNRFVINIQPDERDRVRDFFLRAGLAAPELLPMVRGRFVALNGRPVKGEDYAEPRARQLAEREFNLSWTAVLPAGNRITAGHWFDDATGGFSVEQGLAETLGLKDGDRMAFDVAGQRVEGAVTSLRKLEWDSMRVNFFVVAPPGVLEGFPASYIASFRLGPGREGFGRDLNAAFPGLTLFDVSALLDQLQAMVSQLGRAVQLVFLFSLLAGLLVLWAALEASAGERAAESALLRALGARQAQLRRALLVEFGILGGVAGLLAALGASLLSWSLARFVFHMDYLPAPGFLAGAVLAATVAVPTVALALLAPTLRAPVMGVLKEQ